MKRTKFTLPVQKWGTIKSKYQPESNYVSPDELTVGSNNFITNVSGALEKRPTDVQYNATALSSPGKDQFEAIFANGVHHLLFMDNGTLKYTSGDTIIHTAASGYTAIGSMEYTMYQNRVYFDNGIDTAGVYDLTTAYGSVPYTPPQVKNMGCQIPLSAPTFGSDTSGGSVPVGGHTYKITYLYYGFEESNGGPATTLHTVSSPNQTVNLTAVPVGGYGVTARKVYRDNGDGNYLLVGTISDNTTVIFSDTVSAGTTPIPVSNDLPPVFSYIVLNLSRLWVAGVSGTPTTLYWSNPGLPDIFDPNNYVLCNPKDPIQALAIYQGTTYVLNRHSFGQVLGNTDDTFYYQEFPGSVGCVDNRSVQVRTINGVPTLIWLSDRGFYAFNGSSVEYISDAIEDEVNLNIQQVNFVTGNNTQSTQADFQAGFNGAGLPITTNPGGIDLISEPGTITTVNPVTTYQSEADWENTNAILKNIATNDGSNTIKATVKFAPDLSADKIDMTGLVISGTKLLTNVYPWTRTDNFSNGNQAYSNSVLNTGNLYPCSVTRAGRVTMNITFYNVHRDTGSATTVTPVMGTIDPATGVITYIDVFTPAPAPFNTWSSVTVTFPTILTAGVTYWVGIVSGGTNIIYTADKPGMRCMLTDGTFSTSYNTATLGHTAIINLTFDPILVSTNGSWTSKIYDSYSDSIENAVLTFDPYIIGAGTIVATVKCSNDYLMLNGVTVTTTTINDFGGTYPLPIPTSNKRYWQIIFSLSTPDDTYETSVVSPQILFAAPSTWTSPVIDCTDDATSFNPMTITDSVPSGTAVTVTVATSANSTGPWTGTGNADGQFGPIGSAIVRRYARVKVELSMTSDNLTTPSVSLISFLWNIHSVFQSSVVNAGQIPSGWGLFQDVSADNGGTLTMYMKSASSPAGLAAATYYVVTNGNFPNASVLPNQYVQWKAVFDSIPNHVATLASVTINWFLGSNRSPIRVASLFFNKTYYLAAAETGQTTNNIVIVWDQEGNWRLFRDLNINSLGLFFNQPFYLDAVRDYIYSWLIPPTGTGQNIMMDVRTKAFDGGDYDHLKNPRSFQVMGLNTGTLIHAYYSLDRGNTWIEMLNHSGTLGYQTSTDGTKFYEYFVPNYALGQSVSGVTVMFRVTSEDAFPCKILSMSPEIIVREGKYLGEAL